MCVPFFGINQVSHSLHFLMVLRVNHGFSAVRVEADSLVRRQRLALAVKRTFTRNPKRAVRSALAIVIVDDRTPTAGIQRYL